MAVKFLIKGATILDGCGIPAYEADVRLIGTTIIEAGRNLAPTHKERVFEARGSYLTHHLIEMVCAAAPRQVPKRGLLHPL